MAIRLGLAEGSGVFLLALVASLAGGLAAGQTASVAGSVDTSDHRIYQHGLDILRVGERRVVVWSSWGNPPGPTNNDHWEHDVYYSWLDLQDPHIEPHLLAGGPEAQEPASTAINSRGRILMTCEDGRNGDDLQQSAGLWDSDLSPVRDFPVNVYTGGHSGHVAAMQDSFLIGFCEGWVDGGGLDGDGTGDDIWARRVTHEGVLGKPIRVAVCGSMSHRDWWPVVAASEMNWLVAWQRYNGDDDNPSGGLRGALIGAGGSVHRRFAITRHLQLYHYNITYLPDLAMYAVFGSRRDGGFVSMVGRDGRVVRTRTGLPPTVRESKLIVSPASVLGRARVAYPVEGGGVAVLTITRKTITFAKKVEHPYRWDYMGTDGFFLDESHALFATLSAQGVQLVPVDGLGD